ncbi:MAG: anti-sigma factor [Pyrinomonadaceae bacterium]|nr:anti-sigma factor [Pyrinomonadaceae bacterium]MBP6213719.1 anti-sigma factor [Pyrinomonadaceae bacterium]
MNNELQDKIVDILTDKATFGIDAEEQRLLDTYIAEAGIAEDNTFELTAAAIGLVDLRMDEPMPAHLNARIMASADEFFASMAAPAAEEQKAPVEEEQYQKVFTVEPKRSWNWMGWAVAGFAVLALVFNVWTTRMGPTELAGPGKTPTPMPSPAKVTPDQEFAQMLAAPSGVIKANFGAGNMKDLKEIGGDVVWSDEKQTGYMRLRGLPVNDKSKETYQLWIFDKTQDKATPIDGGTFDVDKNGDVIIPIDAKLKAQGPELFAITVEKPGGVVVSKREKIAALAKVETPAKSTT